MATREARLAPTLIRPADTLVSHHELNDHLDMLLGDSSRWLGCHAGGVMVHDHHNEGRLELLAWVGEGITTVELFQLQQREGPCP